jgi:hypothetical protein
VLGNRSFALGVSPAFRVGVVSGFVVSEEFPGELEPLHPARVTHRPANKMRRSVDIIGVNSSEN